MLLRQAGYFYIAQPKLTHETFQNNKSLRTIHGIVIEVCMSRHNNIELRRWKISQKPLRESPCRIVSPRIGQHTQILRRRDFKRIVTPKLDLDVARASRISTLILNRPN